MTRSEKTNADLVALLKARNSLLWIVTREETRVERAVIDAAARAGYETWAWDCAAGLQDSTGEPQDPRTADPLQMLAKIRGDSTRRVYVLRDLHKWLQDPVTLRTVRSLAGWLQNRPRNEARAIVILSPVSTVPPELPTAVQIDYPLPERLEISSILDSVLATLPEDLAQDAVNGSREQIIDAALGLTAEEAASTFAASLVKLRKLDPTTVAEEKRRVISNGQGLTWTDPDPRGLDAVGGLANLKSWLRDRADGFTPDAREYGLPAPRGALLVGVPGCGKSLCAKALAAAWRVPLLRLDIGGTRSKFVGDSESNIRSALRLAETVAPAVLWIDEIEKALAGSAPGQSADGGVSSDALGTILGWMQDHTAPVFLLATSNDVSALPPELLRKGRFDELFFVDLPTPTEREEVIRAALRLHGRPEDIDAAAVARATDGFSGAEVAALVPDALYRAYADGRRPIATDDLTAAASATTPLSKTAAEKLTALRQWSVGRARPASAAETRTATTGRQLDL